LKSSPTVIIGGGLAGLTCAQKLNQAGHPFLLLDGSNSLGGRLKTDRLGGYQLDHGFQMFLTAYPEAAKVLDYKALNLSTFYPGATVRLKGRFHKLSDPWHRPLDSMRTFLSPIGTSADKIRIGITRSKIMLMSVEEIMSQPHQTTLSALQTAGFSQEMIEHFLKPFFSGIFLEKNLATSRRIFDFSFRMMAQGDNTLPAAGMQAIPKQIAATLPQEQIKLNTTVRGIDNNEVLLSSGEVITAQNIVLATPEPAARNLLNLPTESRFNSQITLYFAAPEPPFSEPIVVINAEKDGIITTLSVQSNVASSYAPAGKALIAISVIESHHLTDKQLKTLVVNELLDWYGEEVYDWSLLRIYRIAYALPDQSPEAIQERQQLLNENHSIILAGDYCESGSINGAILSGKKAAEAILTSPRSKQLLRYSSDKTAAS
jgi:predicted NAD/FAD-dependent oxidoreductase